ncbi:MAG TPA: hypothetical protein VKT78_16140 [Fimbriimonadaceae bacterium]|nr:hypothetical protein [Fimbriimonadaceae bacterium]
MSVVEATGTDLLTGLDVGTEALSGTRKLGIVGPVLFTLAAAQLIWLAALSYLAYLVV